MRRHALGAAILALCALVTACGPNDGPITIGVSLAGNDMIAARLAARAVNDEGGIDGRALLLQHASHWDGVDETPDLAVAHAEALTTDREVVAVIGPADSSSAIATAPIYARARVANVVTLASHPGVTRMGDTIFRLCLSDEQQGRALARYVLESLDARRVALFFVNDDYGRALARTFGEALEAGGGRFVATILHGNRPGPDGVASIRAALGRLSREDSPDAFVLFQRMDAAYETIRLIRAAGFDRPVLGGDALGNAVLLRPRHEFVEGLLASQLASPGVESDDARLARDSIRVATGFEPSDGQLFAYDAVRLVAEALRSEGHGRDDVLRHLERLARDGTAIDGIAGRYAFEPSRDASRALHVVRVAGARFEPVETILPAAEQVRDAPGGRALR